MSETATALRPLVLARLTCSGDHSRAALVRDLAPLVSHVLPAPKWKQTADEAIDALIGEGLATETRTRLAATPAGKRAADEALGTDWPSVLSWPEQRDIRLVAKALGIESESRATLSQLARPKAIQIAVVQKAFGLPFKAPPTLPKLRGQLAVVALERAFGNKIKSGFTDGDGLSPKAQRLLAGHLSKAPRDFGSDAKLIACLAMEQAGADDADDEALRLAVLRGFISRRLKTLDARFPAGPVPANDAAPAVPQRSAPSRPDLNGFAAEVQAAARVKADGWPKKAYISDVWREVRSSAPHWALSEVEFKAMLAEAHRAGRVRLTTADLKDKSRLADIEASAVEYKNAVWHFVRADE